MWLPLAAVVLGLVLLVWSADRFVDGAAVVARHFNMPPLLIGMVILGFGTSAPEMVVSAFAAVQGNPGLALGNAYGSNIANIALIIGLVAFISPLQVHSNVVKRELPILLVITLFAAVQLINGQLSRWDALALLVVFAGLMVWSVWQSRQSGDELALEIESEIAAAEKVSVSSALAWLLAGLMLLILSSRMLVWGAVETAELAGVSDLVIGLTVVAIGTSLPELASSLAALRKGEHDMALGNVIGSNLFNTLVVVGIAGMIHPLAVPSEVLTRDMLVTGLLTLLLFIFAYRKKRQIGRWQGLFFLLAFVSYTSYLIISQMVW
ncbi:inner membrane protein YrbG [Methylophaga lonarensis MPL]|uniref:Inner membrane protein YrbG n=1 Tax=Methylophaga lonarensis MPL TaxID=1286106 RepID=M7NX98_9GAMM|nr:calcium/sodium antiporter [Methylophaga lonarensis]EMR13408.1 inner membrane protein YrbG [Methylophaga lonarensis MPL]